MLALVALLALNFTSCRKPYQEQMYANVEPNETAYVIPLEQGNKDGQKVLKSADYLESKKVASKRVLIPTQWHQEGRLSNDGKWIPSVKVIKVNRAPVTREWTSADGTGTSGNKKEDIEVESKESIGFGIGITATANIPEAWTSKFLYLNSGRTLAQVMDNDVRAYIQNILTSEFGVLDLSGCQENRKAIFDTMRVKTVVYFATMGVKIMNVGAAGGFNYIDEKIQIAINEKFASEMKFTTASNEVKAAKKFAEAKNAIKAQKELDVDIEIKLSQANLNNGMAEGFKNGTLVFPKVMAPSMLEGMFGLKTE